MNAAAGTYTIFGISMQRRGARRKLVVGTYAVLAALCLLTGWLVRVSPDAILWVTYGSLAVGIFIFGGTGRHGLIKSFLNKPPRPEPSSVELVRLRLQPDVPIVPADLTWRNDERELERRNLAHYRAYGPLGIGYFFILLLTSWVMHPTPWHPSQPVLVDLLLTFAMAGAILAITLPAAIILWTEPDFDRF